MDSHQPDLEPAAVLLTTPVAGSERQQQVSGCYSSGAMCGRNEDSAGTCKAEGSPADGLTCAICLDCIDPANLALIPDCEHQYCATCILHWAVHKEAAWCPQCRVPFSCLHTYRALDGSLRDYAASESLCLLKRALWFQEYLQARERGKAPAALPTASDASIPPEVMDWQDYGRFYDEYDDDEEVEAYYFSSAAGRARVTLGNRRWGENGYVSAGRMQARPIAPARPAKAGKAVKAGASSAPQPQGSAASSAASPHPPRRSTAATSPVAAAASPCKSTPVRKSSGELARSSGGGCSSAGGSSEGKNGRRARRNARRAAADARGGCDYE